MNIEESIGTALELSDTEYRYLLFAHVYHHSPVFRSDGRKEAAPEDGVADRLIAEGYGDAMEQDNELWFIPNAKAEQWLLAHRGEYRVPALLVWDRIPFQQLCRNGRYRLPMRDADGYSNFQTAHFYVLSGLASCTISDDGFFDLRLTEFGARRAVDWDVPNRDYVTENGPLDKVAVAGYGTEPEELHGPQMTKNYYKNDPDDEYTDPLPIWLTEFLERSADVDVFTPYLGGMVENNCFDLEWQDASPMLWQLLHENGKDTWNDPTPFHPLEWYVAVHRYMWQREKELINNEIMERTGYADLSREKWGEMFDGIAKRRIAERAADPNARRNIFSDPWYYRSLVEYGYVEELGDDFRFLIRKRSQGLIQSSGPYKDLIKDVVERNREWDGDLFD